MSSEVTIYTDGASSQGVGPGGWAAILRTGNVEREISGFEDETTNQRMELTAALMGLRQLSRPCQVKIISDSAYLVNCFHQRWYERWIENGWRKSAQSLREVANADLWKALLEEVAKHEVIFEHVRGHNGHALNERADHLAVQAKKQRFGTISEYRSLHAAT